MKNLRSWPFIGFCSILLVLIFVIYFPFNPPQTIPSTNPYSTDNSTINITSPENVNYPLVDSASKFTVKNGNQRNQIYSQINPSPQPLSMDEIILRFNSYVEETFAKTFIPGAAVVVVYKDQVVYIKTLGVKEYGKMNPVNFDTIFQIGSCTKAFTSALIASLVDEGLMGFDDKAIEYYPDSNEFALYDAYATKETNMRDLLSHRIGLPTNAGGDLIFMFNYGFNETLYRLRFMRNDTEFRSTFEYNNVLYSVAGESAARAAGISWDDLVETKIFQPLGMFSSQATLNDYINAPNKVSNHMSFNNMVFVVPPSPTTAVVSPAGSVSSSIRDMANWIRLQLSEGYFNGQQVVSSQSLDETHKIHSPRKNASGDIISGYGLGWGITHLYDKIFLDHTGSTISSTSYVSLLPSDELGIVVLANEGPYGGVFNAALVSTFYDLYLKGNPQADYWADGKKELEYQLAHPQDPYEHLPAPPDPPVPPLNLDKYTGNYYSNYYGTIQIIGNNNNLQLFLGNNPQPYNLDHWSGNVFNVTQTNTAANFTVNDTDDVQGVHLRMLDYSGSNGTFNKT